MGHAEDKAPVVAPTADALFLREKSCEWLYNRPTPDALFLREKSCEWMYNRQVKDAAVKGGMTVTAAEDVGDMVVLECGTVQGDSVSTAMLLNNTCAALEKETGRKVSRVVHGTPVDGSAPILSLRLKKSMVRCEGKSFNLAEVPDLARQLTAKAA